ncbi:MAG: hypothetical protein CME68_11805 [Halobacteriovoraceae bacterium]|nr:hypothetical protein [Halobacteriovoraceae bacterium]
MKILLWLILYSSTFSISFYYGKDISLFITSILQKKEIIKEEKKVSGKNDNETMEAGEKKIGLNNNSKNKIKLVIKQSGESEESLIDQLRSSPHYKAIQKKINKKNQSAFITDFMAKNNLEDNQAIEKLNEEIEDSFFKLAEKNPEKLFKSIEENIEEFNDSPIKQAELIDYLTKIKGMEEKAKEVILGNLNQKIPEPEMKITDIKTFEDENKFFSADPKEIAYKMKFTSLISVAENEEEEKKLTMDVFNRQKNKNIQRDIASVYLRKNPTKANNFVDDVGLKKANDLVPSNIEIEDNGNGEYTFIKLIEPKKRNEGPSEPEGPASSDEPDAPINNENPQSLED